MLLFLIVPSMFARELSRSVSVRDIVAEARRPRDPVRVTARVTGHSRPLQDPPLGACEPRSLTPSTHVAMPDEMNAKTLSPDGRVRGLSRRRAARGSSVSRSVHASTHCLQASLQLPAAHGIRPELGALL